MRLGKSRRAGRFAVLMLIGSGSLVPTRAWAQTPAGTDSGPVPTSKPDNAVDDKQARTPVLDTWGTSESNEPPPEAIQKAQVAAEQSKPAEESATEIPSEAREIRPPIDAESDAKAHLRYTLERIEVRGNTRTRERVILRYLKFKPGDILDVDDPELTLTRYRVLGTGFFKDVQFALRKGSRRGQVILVIEVAERNTIVVNDVGIGLSSDADNKGNTRPLTPWGGLDVAETNLGGIGITVGAALAIANEQNALRVRILDPSFLGTPWMISLSILRNRARDFFGTTSSVNWTDWNNVSSTSHSYAIVNYQRFGGSLGVGRDLSTSTQLWAYYRLETIDAKKPLQAAESRGGTETPIEIDVRSGRSVLSTVRATLQHDTRDHPFLPTSGWYVATWGELALRPFGSDYGYQRFDISASHWWKIPGVPHVLRLQVFAGEETADAPFFEKYYIGDFTDFRTPRMLGLNFERRPPPAVFGGIIKEQRYGEYAAKFGFEYRIPVYRGSRSVYGIDLFLGAGLWSLISQRDLSNMPANYHGLARVPLDLTGNIGFRIDTSAGGLTFAFSNILGFIPLHGEGS
jgi:outer membrane protein insertion porin family